MAAMGTSVTLAVSAVDQKSKQSTAPQYAYPISIAYFG
jgi:hypothetical protein